MDIYFKLLYVKHNIKILIAFKKTPSFLKILL